MEKKDELQQLEQELQRHHLVFLYIGSYALRVFHEKELAGFDPPDIDFLIHGHNRDLLDLLASLEQKKWEVKVWGDRFSVEWTVGFLTGKWYIRLNKGTVICDLSFEYPYLDIAKTIQSSMTHANHQMCCLEDLWYLKLLKNAKIAQLFANTYQLPIPEQSMVRWKRWLKEKRW